MGTSTTIAFACLSCGLGFRKDLQLFGNSDEACPHCAVHYVIPAVTNEGVLLEMGMEAVDDMLRVACEKDRGIKTTSVLKELGRIKDDEPSVGSADEEEVGAREEMERRRTKVIMLKERRRSKAKGKEKGEGEEKGEGGEKEREGGEPPPPPGARGTTAASASPGTPGTVQSVA